MRIKQTARKSTCQSARTDPIQSRINNILVTKRHSASPSTSSGANHGRTRASGGKNLAMLKQTQSMSSVKQKPRTKPGVRALKEIRRLQRTTDLQIPRAAFQRLVREICHDLKTTQISQGLAQGDSGSQALQGDLRFQTAALMALQEAAEAYLVNLFEQSYWCTQHANRATLFLQDMHLVQRIRKSLEVQK